MKIAVQKYWAVILCICFSKLFGCLQIVWTAKAAVPTVAVDPLSCNLGNQKATNFEVGVDRDLVCKLFFTSH